MFKTAAIYIIFTALGRSGAFLLLPLLTSSMSKSDFGILAIFSNLMILFTPIISLNANITLSRNFSEENKLLISELENNSLLLFLILIIISTSLLVFPESNEYWDIIFLSLVSSLVGAFAAIHLMNYQLNHDAKSFGITQIIGMLGNVIVTLSFYILDELNYLTRALAILIGLYAPFYKEINRSILSFRPRKIKNKWIREGAKLYPLSILTWFLLQSDKLIMSNIFGLSVAGGYFFIYTLCLPLYLILNGLSRVIYTYIYQYKNDLVYQVKYLTAFTLISFLISILYLPLASFGLEMFIDEKFHQDQIFIFPTICYILISHVAASVQTLLISRGDNKNVTIYTLMAVLSYGAFVFFFGQTDPVYIVYGVSVGYLVLMFMLTVNIIRIKRREGVLC
ncbi:lipopolysaccharide biosynthesis protein [Vibrio ostreicida]|uniref:lipopolysaccharide biosynthesis protein n=1 Tax=Vibrio ostreicida TaxID=526588 RepID=UPI00097106C7|nr:oligosaccharide flippase family protein [Vibrio ostreicida]